MWSSTKGFVLIGRDAIHIIKSKSAPAYVASLIPIPKISATPIPRRPSMKSQSTQTCPARLWKILEKGPAVLLKNPKVGDPPASQDFAGGVEKESPINLSKNAQKKTHPKTTLTRPQILFISKAYRFYKLQVNKQQCDLNHNSSIFEAKMKSFTDNPPIAWVVRLIFTLL